MGNTAKSLKNDKVVRYIPLLLSTMFIYIFSRQMKEMEMKMLTQETWL